MRVGQGAVFTNVTADRYSNTLYMRIVYRLMSLEFSSSYFCTRTRATVAPPHFVLIETGDAGLVEYG